MALRVDLDQCDRNTIRIAYRRKESILAKIGNVTVSEEAKADKTQVQILRDAFEGMKGRQPKSDGELNEWLATDEGKLATIFEPTLGRNRTCLNGAWHCPSFIIDDAVDVLDDLLRSFAGSARRLIECLLGGSLLPTGAYQKGYDPCRTTIEVQLHPASPQTAPR